MFDVGILGAALYLPPEVRTNTWWSPDVVAKWLELRRVAPPPPDGEGWTDGMRMVAAALRAQTVDAFQGAVERRILDANLSADTMEETAARQAVVRAKIPLDEIDLLMTNTVVPDVLLSNPAAVLHHRLGLPARCLSLSADASTYSFLAQLSLAQAMISAGLARYALLVQSSVASRLVAGDDPNAPVFGDAATAVVVGRVATGFGIRGAIHFTDGRYPNSLVMSVRGRRWYDEGHPEIHIADQRQMGMVLLQTADLIKMSVERVLSETGVSSSDIDFFCMHQGTLWLRRVVQDYTGLGGARSVETFTRLGYLFAAIMPAALVLAEQEGLLHSGDNVVLAGGGTGMTYGAMLLRWGSR